MRFKPFKIGSTTFYISEKMEKEHGSLESAAMAMRNKGDSKKKVIKSSTVKSKKSKKLDDIVQISDSENDE